MKKAETMKQLAAATNAMRIDTLSHQIETLHQTRIKNVEELAAILEPLAQAMAALTDETRQTLGTIEAEARKNNENIKQQTLEAAKACRETIEHAKETVHHLNAAGRRLEWSHYLLALTTGCMTAVLVSAFWLWLRPPNIVNQLDAEAVAAHLKPAIALVKPSKSK